MTKADRLEIEAVARAAVRRLLKCSPESATCDFGPDGPSHEFDIFCEGVVVGGVSTSPLKIGGGTSNRGGFDRASAELLWLMLWPGQETRVHVLTDKPLAERLVERYQNAMFPYPISIYHCDPESTALNPVGILQPLSGERPADNNLTTKPSGHRQGNSNIQRERS